MLSKGPWEGMLPVLRAIAEAVYMEIASSKQLNPMKKAIGVVNEAAPKNRSGLPATAWDWQLKVNLGMQLKMPDMSTDVLNSKASSAAGM